MGPYSTACIPEGRSLHRPCFQYVDIVAARASHQVHVYAHTVNNITQYILNQVSVPDSQK